MAERIRKFKRGKVDGVFGMDRYLRYGDSEQDVARIKNAVPWYRHKAEPSFADMLVAIRKKIWGYRFSQHPSLHRVLRNVDDVLPDWSLAA